MAEIKIFDTTLRDRGTDARCQFKCYGKIRDCKTSQRLGVDRIEAGFPASSEGDFQAVKAIADTVKETSVIALARTSKQDIDSLGSSKRSGRTCNSCVFSYFTDSYAI